MPRSLGFGIGPFGIEPFGSPSGFFMDLTDPSITILVRLDLGGATPLRISTQDLYPAALSGVHYERRLLDHRVDMRLSLVNEVSGLQRIEDVTIEVGNEDGSLNNFFTTEMRGNLAAIDLYDVKTDELTANVFLGHIAAYNFHPRSVSMLLTSQDLSLLKELVPIYRVTADDFPQAQDLETVLAHGMGIGERIPGRYVKARLEAGQPDHYDYAFVVGNVGFCRLWKGVRPLSGYTPDNVTITIPFERLHRTYSTGGKYISAIRFRIPMQEISSNPVPVTADLQRVYPDVDDDVVVEWKWSVDFDSDVASPKVTAEPKGSITSLDFVSGPSGFMLAAILFPGGSANYVELPTGTETMLQTSTFEFDVNLGSSGDAIDGSLLVRGPRTIEDDTGGGSGAARGWWVTLLKSGGPYLKLHVKRSGGTVSTTNVLVPYDEWFRVTVVFTSGVSVTIIINEADASSSISLSSETILFDTDTNNTSMFLGKVSDGISYPGYRGKIGFLRVSDVARPTSYLYASVRLMKRNVIQLLTELMESTGVVTVDETSKDNAASDIYDVVDGSGDQALFCDGFITNEVPLGDVLPALTVFRDIRLTRAADEEMEFTVSKANALTDAWFGFGDVDSPNNIVDESIVRKSASLAEAVRTLPVKYRAKRTDRGDFKEYAHMLSSSVLTVGTIAEPLELPFVYMHLTADVIRSMRAKRLIKRDELLTFTTGNVARSLYPGRNVRVDIPAYDIVAATYEVASITKSVVKHRLDLTPYDADVFTYTPSASLPADVPIDDSLALDIGNASTVRPSDNSPAATDIFTLDVRIQERDNRVPIADGALSSDFATIVGASTRWEAVDDDYSSPDDDSTYIESATLSTNDEEEVSFSPKLLSVNPFTEFDRMDFYVRCKVVNSGSYEIKPFIRISGSNYYHGTPEVISSTSYILTTLFRWTENPATNEPWTIEEAEAMEIGFHVKALSSGIKARVTQFYALTMRQTLNPADWSITKLWRQTSDTEPAVGDDPFYTLRQLVGFRDGPLAAGSYWYYAQICDALGRASDWISSVEVTVA